MIKEAKIASIMPLFPLPQYVVVLQDIEKTRLVPIWIGINEGNAIALEMQGEKFPRPLTHDLIVNMLAAIGAKVEKVVVSDLRDNSYFAIIHLKIGDKSYEIDARPSDSLAIAVRVQCPIFIDETVLAKCPPLSSGPITKDEVEKFKDELKSMTPEEFFKKLEETPPAEETPGIGIQFGESLEEGEEEDDNEEGPEDEDGGDEEGRNN
jgi:bifunctional DNase/RNase